MGKDGIIPAQGVVIETLPNAHFKVQLDNQDIVMATLAGRMRVNYIKILPGDTVDLELSVYEPTKGRIIYRHSGKKRPAPVAEELNNENLNNES